MTNAPRSNRSAARAPPQEQEQRLQWMTRRNGLIPAKKGTTALSLSKGRGGGGDGAEATDKDWICLTASSSPLTLLRSIVAALLG